MSQTEEAKPHIITVRLSHPLGEQLREMSYKMREKKQPILRDALLKLILDYETSNKPKQDKILDRITTMSSEKLIPPCTAEKIVLNPEISGLLRWFAFESKQTYQSIVLVALIEYISYLYPKKDNKTTVYVDANMGPNIIEFKSPDKGDEKTK